MLLDRLLPVPFIVAARTLAVAMTLSMVGCDQPEEFDQALDADEAGSEGDTGDTLDVAAEAQASSQASRSGPSSSVWRRARGGGHGGRVDWAGQDRRSTSAGLAPARATTPPPEAFLGEACTSSDSCEAGAQCVADPESSDGQFRCLAVCVDAMNGEPSTILCVDDRGCCDPDAACTDKGSCVSPPAGGSDPSTDGNGCNEGCDTDRDDDGLVNVLDANPDQSCSADADEDGVRDSCDANDMDSDDGCFGCGFLPLSNSTTLAYLTITIVIWRRRRPRRR